MSNKDGKNEKEKPFHERLKKFLKSDKKNLKPIPEIKINDEIRHDLSSHSPLETRLKTIKDIQETVQVKKLQDTGIERIWGEVKDLLNLNNPSEVRHAVINLFSTIAYTTEKLGMRRVYFFQYIVDSYQQEDPGQLFNFFQYLINDGRDVEYIEEDIGPFLTKWLPNLIAHSAVSAIDLATNVLKFNAAHIDDNFIHEIVIMVLNHVFQAKSLDEVNSCLKFMDTLIAYVFVPSGALTKFVATLARLVSIPSIVGDTWKVMRNLLRTELGNTALCSLCELIENEDNFHITRGSIYFVTNAMWSKHKITSLTFRTMAVLTTLRKASESIHPLVIYETAISLSKLVRNHPEELHLPAWDITLDILEKLFAFTANYSNKEQAQMIFNVLNNTIDDIEDQISREAFYGSLSKFYDLVDNYSIQRNPNSISMLLSYKTRLMGPGLEIWLEELSGLLHRHFKLETRAAVRLHALSKLKSIFDNYKWTYHADEICEQVVITQLNEIEKDPDLNVRKEGVSLLIHMAVILKSSVVKTLLHFIGNIVFLPYKFLNLNLSQVSQVSEEEVSLVLQDSRKILDAEKPKIYQEGEVEDIYEGVRGLILIFKKKIWCLPSEFAIDAYQILMLVLQCHYTYPEVLGKVSCIRKEIFQMIFEMRADANYHLGLPNCPDAQIPIDPEDPEDLKEFIPNYTPYIVIDHKHGEKLKPGFDLLLSSKSSLQK
ncbi:Tuberin [Armadillidium vulgare]|nr:Tuberin [Armadillidium vulgare]